MSVSSKIRICIGKGRKCSARTVYHATRLMLVVITGFALAGCMRNRLLQVERIMEYDVAAADSIINTMNVPASKRSNALYAMLKTQIDYKMYRDIQNDSLIRIATDFYGTKYKDYHAAMAWYSLGCMASEFGQDSTAADAYLTAIRLFPDTLVRYYALAEQNLSYIFLEHRMDVEAMPLIRSCRANAVRLKDSAAIAFCDYNIAKSLLYNNKYVEAKLKFLELIDNEWLSLNTINNPLIYLAKIELVDGNQASAISYADLFIHKNQSNVSNSTAYSIKADALYQLNMVDSALHYYELSLTDANDPYTICDVYRRLSEITSYKGYSDSASFFARQASTWMDSITSTMGSENIFRTITNNSKSFQSPNKHKYSLLLIIILSVSAAIIALLSKKQDDTHEDEQTITQTGNEPRTEIISDFDKDLIAFKQSDLFSEMIMSLNERKELDCRKKNEITKKFQSSPNLKKVRSFIVASSTRLNGNEQDFCIFTMVGFEQKDFHRLFNLSQSGSRNLKNRIRTKMPESLFNHIFSNENDGKRRIL